MAKDELTLGKYIKNQRINKLNISQAELGFRVYATRQKTDYPLSGKLSATAIGKWEQDLNHPNFHNLMAMAEIFDISPIAIRNVAEGVIDEDDSPNNEQLLRLFEQLNEDDQSLVMTIISKFAAAHSIDSIKKKG